MSSKTTPRGVNNTSFTAIYVVGASSTGKTTLCTALASRLGLDAPLFITEVARNVMRNTGFTRDNVGELKMQRAIMEAQLEQEDKARTYAEHRTGQWLLLSDRSAIDAIVYSSITAKDKDEAIEMVQSLVSTVQFQLALPWYRRAIFMLLTPIPEWLEDDGVRSLYDQQHCTDVFREVLRELGVGFEEMGVETKALSDRVDRVVAKISSPRL